jgi:hypothetical protein
MIITTLEELKKKLGEFVTVSGVYEQINGSKRRDRFLPSGRACLILSDGNHIAIDTQDAGIRDKEELEQLQGKTVILSGLFMGFQTLWGDGSEASIVSNAILGANVILSQ